MNGPPAALAGSGVVVRWIVSNASPVVASTRIRVLAVIKGLRAAGVDAAMLTDADARCDIAIFCKAYRDKDIALARRLKSAGAIVVFDLCDNHFVLGVDIVQRLRAIMSLAHFWVFSTPALREVAARHTTERRDSEIIPDAVEIDQDWHGFSPVRRYWDELSYRVWLARSGILSQPIEKRLLWFGNHAGSVADSGMVHLENLRPMLEDCAREYDASLTIVSNSRAAYARLTRDWKMRTFYLSWSMSAFLRVLRAHSITLIPFAQTEFNIVKSNNRIALSLYHGVAVVADAIPSYKEFASCAFLDDWSGIAKYLVDPDLRRQHVNAGRSIVAASYLPSHITNRWIMMIAALAARRTSSK